MRFIGDIALDAEVRALASGAITDGSPVVVNSTGTASEVNDGTAASLGSATAIDGSGIGYVVGAFDSNSNKVVVGFQYQAAGTNTGRARVGTISGSSISFGDVATFNDASTNYIASTFDSNSNKLVFAYQDDGNSSYGTAIVGTVSGTDISFGSETVFESATSYYINATFDSDNNKVVIVYTDAGNSEYGTAVVGTVSGTSISFGTPVVYESAASSFNDVVFDSSNNKVVVSYRDGGNSNYGTAIVGTVSGTSISFGTAVVYISTNAIGGTIGFDSNSNKVVIAYKDNSDGRKGKAVVGTVSGTGISFGSAVTYEAGEIATGQKIAFDSNVNKFVIHYEDVDDSGHSKLIVGTVSGTSISFAGETTTKDGNKNYQYAVFDSSANKFAILYNNEAKVFSNALSTNLTSENFIGFAHAAYADGQKATVKTTGSIARNVPQVPSASDSLGSATVFESGALADGSGQGALVSTFDSSNNRVIVAYTDQGNSSYGTVCVGTVSGTTITFGTPTVIESAYAFNFGITFDSNVNKVVIVYTHQPTSETGKAIVGTIDSSDNSISFGTAATFNSSANNSNNKVVFDSNSNKVGIFYRDWGNSQYGTAKVGTISGTDITFGSAVVFESGDTQYINCTFDSSNNKIVVAYQDNGNSNHGTAIVGTISGTSISFGSAAVFESATTREVDITFDSSNNKVVVVYQDNGNSGDGTAIVGTVSGTGISFGSATVFETGDTSRTTAVIGIAFDSNLNKVIVSYYDDADSDYGKYVIGTVSGTSISFATAATFNAATTKYTSTTFDSNENKAVIFYRDDGDSSKGKAIVLAPTGTLEDLTIGQQYFVQTDGSLGTSADDPSVIAGTAIGTSDIIVKG